MISRLVWIYFFYCFFTLSVELEAQDVIRAEHYIAAIEKDRFHGWPANNGLWFWEDEILVGFTQGDYAIQDGHNITGIQESLFTRSKDGGINWTVFDPENFLDDANEKWLPNGKKHLESALDFRHPGFALRVFSSGYHGNDDPEGGFYYSYDRGQNWKGPFFLGEVKDSRELKKVDIQARTDYIILGQREMLVFITAGNDKTKRIGCIKTTDGGQTFDFLGWVTPRKKKVRHIMSSSVQLSNDRFLVVDRKISKDKEDNSVESYISEDGGKTWKSNGTVKKFESSSNPPAILRLADGRIICVYGDRHNSVMAGKYSSDEGKTWGKEFIIRDGFRDVKNTWDFGYPRIAQNNRGQLIVVYYWSSPQHQQQHIAATIWDPETVQIPSYKENR
ncbi:exo-alpha-sialidase [Membranihabitans maritimus]|uniref:exo-alpha-sialidase n=1 Tax=Membranihabitans maritimus TaxID=2904244 RepID=UPI001F3D10A2|nr:sialidase family protein [Membranihabitans maritimus]